MTPRYQEPNATMKAIHLYIGVFIGCSVLVGTAVHVDRRITVATEQIGYIKADVSDLKTSSRQQTGELQSLRLEMAGMQRETRPRRLFDDVIERLPDTPRLGPR